MASVVSLIEKLASDNQSPEGYLVATHIITYTCTFLADFRVDGNGDLRCAKQSVAVYTAHTVVVVYTVDHSQLASKYTPNAAVELLFLSRPRRAQCS